MQARRVPLVKLPAAVKIVRSMINHSEAIQRFRGCWLMADRAHTADDNAEHFYRYVMNRSDAPPVFFLLDANSPDWERLADEGFNLIPFGSYDHVAAVVHADKVISSQATPVIRYPLLRGHIGDLCHADFVFLQHGIIINDCSGWINNHTYKYFVTSTLQEYASLTSNDGPYNLTERNTILTGLARHNSLFHNRNNYKKNVIAITPTWRNYLASKSSNDVMHYSYNRDIFNTSYARQWKSLLESPKLLELSLQTGCKITLAAHHNIRDYFRASLSRDYIYIPEEDISYQNVILRSAICLTDYSSVAMDMAAIDIPIVYFQFPEAELHAGRHTSQLDDFDYSKHGFGPVADNVDDAVAAMREVLAGSGEDHIYRQRRAETFICCDGQACARLYEILRGSELNSTHCRRASRPTTLSGQSATENTDKIAGKTSDE